MEKYEIDGDGLVTSADAVLLAKYLVDSVTFSDAQFYSADINGDGVITSADAALIAKMLLN